MVLMTIMVPVGAPRVMSVSAAPIVVTVVPVAMVMVIVAVPILIMRVNGIISSTTVVSTVVRGRVFTVNTGVGAPIGSGHCAAGSYRQ